MTQFIIRGGSVVDGTGAAPFIADVAVQDGRIVAVGPDLALPGADEIDAHGLLVTPGFIDVHTHYDGQVTWDDAMLPSSAHGVTTAVIGACGMGFAPVRKGTEDWLIRLMEGVEDIPGTALHVGLPWNWESFTDYLDAIAARKYAFDIAAQIPHSAVRAYVLKERAETDEPATAEDLAQITQLVSDGIKAGAIGIGTSRIVMHRGSDGGLLPGTFAAEDELLAMAQAMREAGGGIMQIVPSGSVGGIAGDDESESMFAGNESVRDRYTVTQEIEMMRRISARAGVPVTFSFSENGGMGKAEFEAARAAVEEIKQKGERIFPQFGAKPAGALSTLEGYHVFMQRPTYLALKSLPLAQLVERLRDPEIKAKILGEGDVPIEEGNPMDFFHVTLRNYMGTMFVINSTADYEPDPAMSVTQRAVREGRDPFELLYDLYLENDGKAVLAALLSNYSDGNLNSTADIIADPYYIISLGDAGAHVGVIVDASYPTFMLSYWGRDRRRGPTFPVETLIAKMTGQVAEKYGFSDRGRIAPGLRADINVIDFERMQLGAPHIVRDLPADAQRFLQDATGYVCTIVNGEITRRDDTDTGARPGRLVRKQHSVVAVKDFAEASAA